MHAREVGNEQNFKQLGFSVANYISEAAKLQATSWEGMHMPSVSVLFLSLAVSWEAFPNLSVWCGAGVVSNQDVMKQLFVEYITGPLLDSAIVSFGENPSHIWPPPAQGMAAWVALAAAAVWFLCKRL